MNTLMIAPLFAMLRAQGEAMGSDTILQDDPHGLVVSLVSIVVVLSALVILALLIWAFSKGVIYLSKQQAIESRRTNRKSKESKIKDEELFVNGEVIAVITMALKLHKGEMHDRESEVITMNSVARSYSPWSSKIHGLTKLPR